MATNETLSIKRTPFYLFLVLLGFLIFYIFDYIRDKDKPAGDDNYKVITESRRISDDTAKLFMENYLKDQASLDSQYRLVTKADEQLRGFWLSKATLESINKAIQKEDPKAHIEGYSIYFGKTNPEDKKRVYNLVVRGAIAKSSVAQTGDTQKNRALSSSNGSDIQGSGPYYDYVEPCPQRCGD